MCVGKEVVLYYFAEFAKESIILIETGTSLLFWCGPDSRMHNAVTDC